MEGDISKMKREDQIVEILVRDSVKRTIDHYGIEGAEDVIKRVYEHTSMHKCRDRMLKTLHSFKWNLNDPELFKESE